MTVDTYTQENVNIEPNREDALHFLRMLWGDTPPEGFYSVTTIDPPYTYFYDSMEDAASKAVELAATQNAFYRVGLMKERPASGRGKANLTSWIPGFWAEVDYLDPTHSEENLPPDLNAALELVHSLEIVPSITVESGSGIHCYWLLDHPQEVTDDNRGEISNNLLKVWHMVKVAANANGWEVDKVTDLSRMLRIPGTLNRKKDTPRLVKLSNNQEPMRYSLDQFDALPIPPEEQYRPSSVSKCSEPKQGVTQRKLDLIYEIAKAAKLRGIERTSDGIKCFCPFHEERTPSFIFTVGDTEYDRANFKCFGGTCGKTGSIVDLVGYFTNMFNPNTPLDDDEKQELVRIFVESFGVLWFPEKELEEAVTKERVKESLARLDAILAGEVPQQVEVVAPPRLFMTGGELLDLELPPQRWLLEGLIDEGGGTLLLGKTGLGKSSLSLQLALAIASGRPFLDVFPTGDPKKVVFFQAENTIRINQRRLRDFAHAAGISEHYVRDNILFAHNKKPNTRTYGKILNYRGEPQIEFLDYIRAVMEQTQAKVMVVDPLSSYAGCPENSNDLMRIAVDIISELADEFEATPIVLHHEGKAGSGNDTQEYETTYASRGASSVPDWATQILQVKKIKKEDGIYDLTWGKVRDGTKPVDTKLRLTGGGFHVVCADISYTDVWTIITRNGGEVRTQERMLDLIKGATDLNGGLSITKAKAKTLLAEAIQHGFVEVETGPSNAQIYRAAQHPNSLIRS